MREGSLTRDFFLWSFRLLKLQKAISRRIAFLAICFLVSDLQAQSPLKPFLTSPSKPPSTEQAAQPTPSPAPAAPASKTIPLPQIAEEAEKLDELLQEVSKRLAPLPKLLLLDPEAKTHADEVSQRAREAERVLADVPNMMQLQDQDRYWRALAEKYSSQRKLLTERAAGIEKEMRLLDAEEARWQETSEYVRDTAGLQVVAERIQRELEAIRELRSKAQEQLNLILTFQNRIYEQDREISGVLLKLDEAHELLRRRLLERNTYPLWEIRKAATVNRSLDLVISESIHRGFLGARDFVVAKRGYISLMIVVQLIALVCAFHLKRYAGGQQKLDTNVTESRIFARPFSIALLIPIVMSLRILSSAPVGVSFLISLLALIPVLRLLPLFVERQVRNILYALCGFYIIVWAQVVLQLEPAFKRNIFALIIFLALLTFIWLTVPSRLRLHLSSAWRGRLLIAGTRIAVVLLLASLCANIVGFVFLSQLIGVGTLFSAFTFAALYTTVSVLDLCLVLLLSAKRFRSLPNVRREIFHRWGSRVLAAAALLLWLTTNLYFLSVRDNVVGVFEAALHYPIGFGKVHFTLAGTFSLVFALLVGYGIANLAKFILEEILLPRVSLRGGMAYAISRVTYYILLVGLFFAALTNAGVELNKFTVISGALGLGVGFGLQNIVNNFASGLIILFERPFRIGDTVEVCGVVGTVRRIGARSTTVLTFQYAEVILPNSNLLSNQVTNWTLTSARRRVEVPVGIAFGTDPELALKLLLDVATSNPRILKDPPPEAFFLGFGESALNLELRFWASQSHWFELKSEIGLAVFRSLVEAGIEIPYPQRDLHLRSVDSAVKEGLSIAEREASGDPHYRKVG